jgi:hypothetical protein
VNSHVRRVDIAAEAASALTSGPGSPAIPDMAPDQGARGIGMRSNPGRAVAGWPVR